MRASSNNGLHWLTRGVLAFALSVCGGKAVIDADTDDAGSSGSGGAGTTTGTAQGPTTGPSVTTTTSGMNPTFCGEACGTLGECGGDVAACLTNCEDRAALRCGDLHQAWISCSLGETNSMCGFGPGQVCGPPLDDYLDCTNEVVGATTCSGGPDGCLCEVFASPGLTLSQSCDDAGCSCFVGGLLAGTCTAEEADCDLVFGCCAGIFFTGAL